MGSWPVVVKESELDIIVYYLARDKEKGGGIPILDSCTEASLTYVCHKDVRVMSEFARLFAELTCPDVRSRSLAKTPVFLYDHKLMRIYYKCVLSHGTLTMTTKLPWADHYVVQYVIILPIPPQAGGYNCILCYHPGPLPCTSLVPHLFT
jgi:hypothetical protein